MKKFVALFMLLALAACGGKEVEQPTGGILEPVRVSEKHRILVLPFVCNILAQGNEATAVMLQNQLSAQVVYMLQTAGVPAEQYQLDMNEWSSSQPASYATLLPRAFAPGGGGLPLANMGSANMAATSFEEVTDWSAQVVPPRNVQQFGQPIPSAAVGDTDYSAAGAEKETKIYADRQKVLEEAKLRGYDYVLSGTIALVRTDVSPSIKIAGSERATIRSELNCSFQLLAVKDGGVGKAGSARGRDAKMIVVKDGALNSYHVYGALDKVMHQAIFQAAKHVAETLTDMSLTDLILKDEVQEEYEYYHDTPGKQLRPVQTKK